VLAHPGASLGCPRTWRGVQTPAKRQHRPLTSAGRRVAMASCSWLAPENCWNKSTSSPDERSSQFQQHPCCWGHPSPACVPVPSQLLRSPGASPRALIRSLFPAQPRAAQPHADLRYSSTPSPPPPLPSCPARSQAVVLVRATTSGRCNPETLNVFQRVDP